MDSAGHVHCTMNRGCCRSAQSSVLSLISIYTVKCSDHNQPPKGNLKAVTSTRKVQGTQLRRLPEQSWRVTDKCSSSESAKPTIPVFPHEHQFPAENLNCPLDHMPDFFLLLSFKVCCDHFFLREVVATIFFLTLLGIFSFLFSRLASLTACLWAYTSFNVSMMLRQRINRASMSEHVPSSHPCPQSGDP